MKAVVDTNIIVSATLSPSGRRARVLQAWHDQRFELVVSESILAEYQRATDYPEVTSRRHLDPGQVGELLRELRQFATVVESAERLTVIAEDPEDDKFVECAVSGGADYIVSGDRHLLKLGYYRGVRILSAGEFLALLEQEGQQL